MEQKKIRKIEATEKAVKDATIYCRVSTGSAAQIKSLQSQVSALTRIVYYIPNHSKLQIKGHIH